MSGYMAWAPWPRSVHTDGHDVIKGDVGEQLRDISLSIQQANLISSDEQSTSVP